MASLPPCGLYRTTVALGDHVPAGRLVYFHNHGDPGAGVYLPASWSANRARWRPDGHLLPTPEWARTLTPLPAEGLYRVRESFTCCAKNCRTYEVDLLVQLGYDGAGRGILFVPEWTSQGLAIPGEGLPVDPDRLAKLAPLKVVQASAEPGSTAH